MQADGATSQANKDGLYLWPIFIAAAAPLVLVLAGATPLGVNFLWVLVGMRAVLLLWAAAGLWSAWLSIAALRHRAWRGVLSALILPAAVLVVAVDPVRFVQRCREWGDILNFEFLRGTYQARAAALPKTGQPKLAVFNRGGMVWASKGIVYDESDEVTLPPGRQSSAWVERASHTELTCGFWVRPLGSHFYLGYFDC
jgi:hypothetical protein